VNVETKEQSRQWIKTHLPNKQKIFKQMSAGKLGICFLGQERMLMMEFTQQGTALSQV
jgi:hypothetical protein